MIVKICLSCHNPCWNNNGKNCSRRKIHFDKKLFKLYFKLNLFDDTFLLPFCSERLFCCRRQRKQFFVCASDALKALIPLSIRPPQNDVFTPEGKNKKQTLYYVFSAWLFMYCYVLYRVRGYERVVEFLSRARRSWCHVFNLTLFKRIYFLRTKLVCRIFLLTK